MQHIPFTVTHPSYVVPRYAEPLPVDRTVIDKLMTLTVWERFTLAIDDGITKVKFYAGLTPHLFQITKGLLMKSWKTTISALIGALAYVINAVFGLQIPSEAIIAVALFAVGFFAKDSDVTGGTVQQ